jgi:hypothetical protein
LRAGLREDREDLDGLVRDVIEHPYLADTQPKLRFAQTPEPLDSGSALLRRLVPQMSLQCISDLSANARG